MHANTLRLCPGRGQAWCPGSWMALGLPVLGRAGGRIKPPLDTQSYCGVTTAWVQTNQLGQSSPWGGCPSARPSQTEKNIVQEAAVTLSCHSWVWSGQCLRTKVLRSTGCGSEGRVQSQECSGTRTRVTSQLLNPFLSLLPSQCSLSLGQRHHF